MAVGCSFMLRILVVGAVAAVIEDSAKRPRHSLKLAAQRDFASVYIGRSICSVLTFGADLRRNALIQARGVVVPDRRESERQNGAGEHEVCRKSRQGNISETLAAPGRTLSGLVTISL